MKKSDSNYEFLENLYMDESYPDSMVSKIKEKFQNLIHFLENGETDPDIVGEAIDDLLLDINIIGSEYRLQPPFLNYTAIDDEYLWEEILDILDNILDWFGITIDLNQHFDNFMKEHGFDDEEDTEDIEEEEDHEYDDEYNNGDHEVFEPENEPAINESWKCPVCGASNDGIRCSRCLFDVRRSFAVYPSVTKLKKQELKKVQGAYIIAQLGLGDDYSTDAGVEQNDMEAVKWYRKVASLENVESPFSRFVEIAQLRLGETYADGLGVRQNYEEAVKWYQKAADQGNAMAQYKLGDFYSRGEGVEQSDTEAAEWYRKAAEQGNADAQARLGACYYDGRGVKKDKKEAMKWYQKAADQGEVSAKLILEHEKKGFWGKLFT